MAQSSPLISAEELAALMRARSVCVLDASWVMPGDPRDPAAMFAARRIPGAQHFDIDAVSDKASALPHMMPSPEEFERAVRALGVRRGQTIVVYDDVGMMSAPRVWWSFRAMRAEDVRVLDGGLQAWADAGFAMESGPASPAPAGDFVARARPELVRAREDVEGAIANQSAVILDARAAPRFLGEAPEPRPGLRSGRMAGAKNVPWNGLIGADGKMKSEAELRALLFGAEDAEAVICTCGSGVSACIIALALAKLGHSDAAIYDGSWAEWGLPDGPPVVVGA